MNRSVLLLLLLIVSRLEADHLTMTLQKALDLKIISAKAIGLGGYSGKCIKMELKNLVKDSVIVMIEAGRRLDSKGDKYQDILIVKDQLITLGKYQVRSLEIKGYCCQARNMCPMKNSFYNLGKMADSNLVAVARILSDGEFPKDIEQQAIWSVSDNYPVASITHKNDSIAIHLRKMVAAVKGEQLPWYTVQTETYVYSNGLIITNALYLIGNVRFFSSEDSYATLSIYNKKGEMVGFTRSEWVKAAPEQDYSLNIPIKGLAKGKYILEIKTPGKQLASREFEI